MDGRLHNLHERSQQFEDVRDKIGDLIPVLAKLKQNLTAAIFDADGEKQRRSELSRYAPQLFTMHVYVNGASQDVGGDRETITDVARKGSCGSVHS